MANTEPTKLGLLSTVGLIFLFVFAPKKFIEKENEDNKYRESLPEVLNIPRIYKLRRALLHSFLFITISGIIGFGIGKFLSYLYANPDTPYITTLQIISALILLWATLALRGWDIQSLGGVTFTERMNQWIYRFLYLLGTSLFLISMTWK